MEGGRERKDRNRKGEETDGEEEGEKERGDGNKNGWTANIYWYVLVHHEVSLEEPPRHWTECINRRKLGD